MQCYRLVGKGGFSASIGTAGDCCAVSGGQVGGSATTVCKRSACYVVSLSAKYVVCVVACQL